MSILTVNGRCQRGTRNAERGLGHELSQLAAPSARIAVVVTCHAAYLPFLPETLASVDAQIPSPAERILCLDDCEGPECYDGASARFSDATLHPWRVIHGQWHNPNPARNAGWRGTTAPWVVFWDGDDVMPSGYLAALEWGTRNAECGNRTDALGIVYPTLNRGSYDALRAIDSGTPDWSYWGQRHSLYIQSGAAWRRSALLQAGGWDDEAGVHDDGNLAARITALGWQAKRLAHPVVKLRAHDRGHRWMLPGRVEALWRFRTLTIVIPVVRPERLPTIFGTLVLLDVPAHTSVLIMDNTPGFECEWMLPSFMPLPFEDFRIMRVPARYSEPDRGLSSIRSSQENAHALRSQSARYNATADGVSALRAEPLPTENALRVATTRAPSVDGDRNSWFRHQHIAAIYNRAFRACTSDMVFTWEDDVRIPRDAVRLLWEHFQSGSDVGAASGVYESAAQPGYVCGSQQFDRWSNCVPMAEAPTACETWGFIPGGCTLWAGHALYPQLPLDPKFNGPGVEGWDAQLSRALRAAGLRVLMDGRVRCEHDFQCGAGSAECGEETIKATVGADVRRRLVTSSPTTL